METFALQQEMGTLFKTLEETVNHFSVNQTEHQAISQKTQGFQVQFLSKEHLRKGIVTKDLLDITNSAHGSGAGVLFPVPSVFKPGLYFLSTQMHSMNCLLVLCP